MNLTPHFTLQEMTASQAAARYNLDNVPSEEILKNLVRTCWLLEKIRSIVDAPIRISSGYRSIEVNKLVGGASNSQHTLGCAADFTAYGKSLDDVIIAIKQADLPYDQLIREFNSWVHISVPSRAESTPRKQCLIIDKNGTRLYT